MRAYRKANKNNSLSGDQCNGGRNCKGTVPNNMALSGHRVVGLQKRKKEKTKTKKRGGKLGERRKVKSPIFSSKISWSLRGLTCNTILIPPKIQLMHN